MRVAFLMIWSTAVFSSVLTGLGLAISKAIVEMHRGSICAQSDGLGKGATFIVELPTVRQ